LHSSPLSAGHANMPFRTETPGPKRTQSELSSSFRNFSNVPGNAKASAKNSRHPQPSLTRSTGLGKHLSGTWKHGQGGCVVTCHICEFEQTEWDSIRPACACLLGDESWDAREMLRMDGQLHRGRCQLAFGPQLPLFLRESSFKERPAHCFLPCTHAFPNSLSCFRIPLNFSASFYCDFLLGCCGCPLIAFLSSSRPMG
jgi:hypothetical protein